MSPVIEVIALSCISWYIFIALVCTIGYLQLFLHYRTIPKKSLVSRRPKYEVPHVTVIRPCKGKEPYLYECLAATFQQDYPLDKLTIYLCISSRDDPAFSTLERVLKDYHGHDARIFVEEEDPVLLEDGTQVSPFGPNPKIRNMSRAYRKAKGDILWIVDCNIWVNRGTCGRMVDKLCGITDKGETLPYKFVHQLPVAVDVEEDVQTGDTQVQYEDLSTTALLPEPTIAVHNGSTQCRGGRLEELFLSSSHAKMYVAINVVAVAPCIVGKSNMFRISHLNRLTNKDKSPETRVGSGIDYFSHNICEDHLIGDLLWKSNIPATTTASGKRWRNHGLVLGDLAIQPVANMTISNYIARRVRWLRVRKFTVPVATLVEPGTESFLCSLYGAFGVTTSKHTQYVFGNSWLAMLGWWLASIAVWAAVDRTVYLLLHSGWTIEADTSAHDTDAHKVTEIPPFANPLQDRWMHGRRSFLTWFSAWLGREVLALPIWTWAIWGGVSVTWRDKRFWVGMDMKVHVYDDDKRRKPKDMPDARRNESNGSPRHMNGMTTRRRREA